MVRTWGGGVLIIISVILVIGGNLYWWQNPGLTSMQAFQDIWQCWVGAVLCVSVGGALVLE